MPRVRRTAKTITDDDLIRFNSLGFSLATIGATLGCHPTTVTLRLKELGIPPADTRRTFMEDILRTLPTNQLDWVEDQLGPHTTIKDFVKSLIVNEFLKSKK